MVQHAQGQGGAGGQRDLLSAGARLQLAQPGEAAVQQADVGIGRNQGDGDAIQPGAPHQVAFVAELAQLLAHGGCGIQAGRQVDAARQHDGIGASLVDDARLLAQQSLQATLQLGARRAPGRAVGAEHQDRVGNLRALGGGEGLIAQPQLIAILCGGMGRDA